MANQISVPQSGSAHAAWTIRAASSGDGGRGFGGVLAGGSANSIGFVTIHRSRWARRNAPLNTQWTCLMLDAESGRHS